MSSKWLDSAICLASFHYQSKQYDDIRPLSFGSHPNLWNETRDGERCSHASQHHKHQMTPEECEEHINDIHSRAETTKRRTFDKMIQQLKQLKSRQKRGTREEISRMLFGKAKSFQPNATKNFGSSRLPNPSANCVHSNGVCDEEMISAMIHPTTTRWRSSFPSAKGIDWSKDDRKRPSDLTGMDSTEVPSLFLQETAHLFSLLSAVAMSSLRADIEGCQSPLTEYIPNQPWPPVNPNELSPHIKLMYHESPFKLRNFIDYVLGLDRTARQRTLYNAARPFQVIGGISDDEAKLLQEARGPYAEMALCNMWLKEFVSREYLNGSTGNVAPPIVARVYQFISDGVSA